MSGSTFTVNPETCPECADLRDETVELQGGSCPECGFEA